MKKRISKMIFLGIKQFSDPYYQGFAAQLAFYFLLSIVPIIIVLSQLFGAFNIPVGTIENMIGKYIKAEMLDTITPLLTYSGSAASSNIVLLIMALWAASRAQFSMMRITNYTITSGKSTGKGFWRERIRSIVTLALTLFTFAFVAIILVYGQKILLVVFGSLFEHSFINDLWSYLRWPMAAALYFLMVTYIYYVLPSERGKLRDIIPGSIFGSVAMLVVTIFYSMYVKSVSNYNIIYGSLASIVALLFWFYFLSWALCLGVLFNKVWRDTKSEEGVVNV